MKFIKFLGKIGYAATTSFGFAALITGFISVFKVVLSYKSINSFLDVLEINNSTFGVYLQPITISFFFILLITYIIFALLGKRKLLDNQIPF